MAKGHRPVSTVCLSSSMTRWMYCNRTNEQVWEVVKVDPAVGGSVIMKGGVNNLAEEERFNPWSQFGLSMLGNGTLM